MNAICISSDQLVDDNRRHFRVSAGPGAGKTYWLVKQIQHVIRNSSRLVPCTRIACISYTNVAVRKITHDLDLFSDRVEVSTIHSFLYSNVVNPYLYLLKGEDGESLVNYASVNRVTEHRPAFDKVESWLRSVNPRNVGFFYQDSGATVEYLKKVTWQLDKSTGNWYLKPMVPVKPVQYLPTLSLDVSYKLQYWREGVIDYDDVLYFSYRILDENPVIQEFLSARYPYIFIDEFQDTNPIQTQVVHWFAEQGAIVGVIGDLEQSIYKFQGARREDFEDFQLPGQIDYTIPYNRRSTERIITFLNQLRTDALEQEGYREVEGEPVRFYVGEIEQIVPEIIRTIPDEEQLVILARKNKEVDRARRLAGEVISDVWGEFEEIDKYRFRFIESLITAGELARHKEYSVAIKTLFLGIRVEKDPFRFAGSITDIERRGLSISLLEFLLDKHEDLLEKSLLEFYQLTSEFLGENVEGLKLKGVRSGRFKTFAESVEYEGLASTVNLTEDVRNTRTIHKAKADDFNNVLVYFEDEEQSNRWLRHILDSSNNISESNEEDRIIYVACSRAIERLYIAIPVLADEYEDKLNNEIEVHRI
jgi:DNA helicase-2/ATP-dependent DNA helicase PcrA